VADALIAHSTIAMRETTEVMTIEAIDPIHILDEPPELTQEIASTRWRELNCLIHSIVLLGDELDAHKPLVPVLRAAATVGASERAHLFQWNEASHRLHATTFLGSEDRDRVSSQAGELQAHAALLHRKPVLVSRGALIRRSSAVDDALLSELERLGARSVLSVPLTHQGMPWGAIQLLRDKPFERHDGVLLWLFCLVLEGVLPSLIGSKRHREMTAAVDPMTGLLTPAHFRRRLSWELQRSAWMARPATVACIEVTEMLHGRPRGSSTSFSPREASLVLQKSLRPADSATCMGGQHYIAVMPDTTRPVAESLAGLIREGFLLRAAGTLPVFDVVTGFATFPDDGGTDTELIRAACAAGRRRQRRVSRNPLAC